MGYLIPVKYFSQRDNAIWPSKTCGPTSVAMVLNSWGIKVLPDQVTTSLHELASWQYAEDKCASILAQGYSPHNIHSCLKWFMRRHIPSADFMYPGITLGGIGALIKRGCPVIVSGQFPGLLGHIAVVVGLTDSEDFILHDPFGDHKLSYARGSFGRYCIMEKDTAGLVLNSGINKWAHICDLCYEASVMRSFTFGEIQVGESFASFAKRVSCSPSSLLLANGLESNIAFDLNRGHRLVVPREIVSEQFIKRLR